MEAAVPNDVTPHAIKENLPSKPSIIEITRRRPPVANNVVIDSSGDGDKHDMAMHSSKKAGFSNLPNQLHRKAIQRGFTFNLMLTGSPGIGKSTFVNTLFHTDIYNAEYPGPSKSNTSGDTVVRSRSFLACGSQVKLRLCILDTPGFGQNVDNSSCWKPIVVEVESRHEAYLRSEMSINRVTTGSGGDGYPTLQNDNRVHACLYFLSPNIHTVHELDIEAMKSLCDKVNLIVVISKADSLTPVECAQMKQMVTQQLAANNIHVYDFPNDVAMLGAGGTDQKWLSEVVSMRQRQPFAVASSDRQVEQADGKKVFGRVYPWGIVEIENLKHNDFNALQRLLLDVHLENLTSVTHTEHYANYATKRLLALGEANHLTVHCDGSEPLSQLAAERAEQVRKLKVLEAEMEAVFEQKVQERRAKLREKEEQNQVIDTQTEQRLAAESADLQKRRTDFEKAKAAWEAENYEMLEAIDVKEKTRTKKKGLF